MKQETNIQLAVPEKNTGPCIPGDRVLQLCLIDIVSDKLSRIPMCIPKAVIFYIVNKNQHIDTRTCALKGCLLEMEYQCTNWKDNKSMPREPLTDATRNWLVMLC